MSISISNLHDKNIKYIFQKKNISGVYYIEYNFICLTFNCKINDSYNIKFKYENSKYIIKELLLKYPEFSEDIYDLFNEINYILFKSDTCLIQNTISSTDLWDKINVDYKSPLLELSITKKTNNLLLLI